MSPEDLHVIQAGAASVSTQPDWFTNTFYETLFEMAPSVRDLFPHDLTTQRRKLMSELTALITLATSAEHDLPRFVGRCRALGSRHVGYGAVDAHYPVVGAALIEALASTVAGWNDQHLQAWTKLYRLVSEAMREGARSATTVANDGSAVRP